MPDIKAALEFLADLPLYESEKPYLALLSPREGFDPDKDRTDNLEWETHQDLLIRDIRTCSEELTIDEAGFQVSRHQSHHLAFDTMEDLEAHKRETEQLLQEILGVQHVRCYDLKVIFPFKILSNSDAVIAPQEHQI